MLGTKFYIPARYVLVGTLFMGLFVASFIATNLSLAIVAMVKKPQDNCTLGIYNEEWCSNGTDSKSLEGTCPITRTVGNETTNIENQGSYAWSTTVQGAILGSYFYGIAAIKLFVGRGADKLNNRWFVGITMLLGSIFTALVPIASDFGYVFLIVLRAMTGMPACVIFVCMPTLLVRWIPQMERNLMYGLSVSGFHLGQLIGPLVVGWLCKQSFAGGWPSVFYIVGFVGTLWSILWMFMISGHPSDHPRISDEEKKYILQETPEKADKSEVAPKTPWKLMLTSGKVWWYIFSFTCSSWILFTKMTLLPKYLAEVLHFPIQENGEILALVNGVFVLSTLSSGFIADKILAKKWLSKTNTRKLMETFGLGGSSLMLLGVINSGCDSKLVLVFLTLSSLLHGFVTSGDNVLAMDLAPTLTGTLLGISNTISSSMGFISPLITGLILDSEIMNLTLNEKWNIVFYLSSFIGIMGTSAAFFFWSAKVQPWDPTYSANGNCENGKCNEAYVEDTKLPKDEKLSNINKVEIALNDAYGNKIIHKTEELSNETQNDYNNKNFELYKRTQDTTISR